VYEGTGLIDGADGAGGAGIAGCAMIGGVVGLLNVGPGAGVPKVGPGAGLGLRNCAFAGPATAIKAAIRMVRLIRISMKSPRSTKICTGLISFKCDKPAMDHW